MNLTKIMEKSTISTGHSRVRYLNLNDYKKSMQIITKLRERKDHFMITIYKEYRKNLDISVGDIIILNLDNYEIIRKIKKDFHISLPKSLLKNKSNGDEIELSILQISKKENCFKRPKSMVKNNKIDIRHFIPKKTIFNHPIYIIDRNNDYSSVWYPIGGGVRHVTIKNRVDIDKIAELIGFYFGDGSTSENIRSFRLTNCEPSVLNYCLDILQEIGIKRNNCKVQIIYSTNKELTEEIKNKCTNFWSKTLNLNKSNIVSVNKSKNVRETLKYGSARIFIDNTILVEIFLHGLLKSILLRITNPENIIDKRLLNGFTRGLLAAEGAIYLNKNGSVVKIGMSYDPHSRELDLYKKLLSNLDINYGGTKGNEFYIYGYKNIKKLHNINAFKMHKSRNQKFVNGILNHRFFKTSLSK
ncbi:MAG: hypothetical protein IH934_07115 [Nanoarchaeota archaeon]|nr:hypothetical protein [Nanoarchaeota archaeon]